MDLDQIIEYVKEKHAGQKRRNKEPYYTHPINVARILRNKGFPAEYQITALLHDLLEDTDATYEEILGLTTPEIAQAVSLLTKESGYVMSDYIDRINANQMAKMVKLADRVHNLSDTHPLRGAFKRGYLKETEEWYVALAKGTVFEEDMNREVETLNQELEEERTLEIG